MRLLKQLPWWFFELGIRGADDDADDDENDDDTDADEEDSEESDDSEDDDDDDDSEEEDSNEDTTRLKNALKKERAIRRTAEKDAKTAKKELARKTKKEGTTEERATESEAKATRLAGRLRTNAVDLEITKAAQSLGFRDVDDALALVNRSDIDVDQDDDEPEDVVVDEDSVMDALKALAKKKKHLIRHASDDDEADDLDEVEGASGSKMKGKRKKDDPMSEAALRERYPALGRNAPVT